MTSGILALGLPSKPPQFGLFNVWQDICMPRHTDLPRELPGQAEERVRTPFRQMAVGVGIQVDGQCELPEVRRTLNPRRGIPHPLNGRQAKADEHGDNGNHNDRLDKRDTGAK
jgi:hypothetical protein